MSSYFADTFALIEYLRGNEDYARYIEEEQWVTSLFNLIEMYYAVLKDNDQKAADESLLAFRRRSVEITDDDIRTGMKFRLLQKAKRLDFSYADAIGYSIATRRNFLFLTGDKAFEGLMGVQFLR